MTNEQEAALIAAVNGIHAGIQQIANGMGQPAPAPQAPQPPAPPAEVLSAGQKIAAITGRMELTPSATFTANAQPGNVIRLQWAITDPDWAFVSIERSVPPGLENFQGVNVQNAAALQLDDGQLQAGTTYRYRLTIARGAPGAQLRQQLIADATARQ